VAADAASSPADCREAVRRHLCRPRPSADSDIKSDGDPDAARQMESMSGKAGQAQGLGAEIGVKQRGLPAMADRVDLGRNFQNDSSE
jgi:hypothetical protein